MTKLNYGIIHVSDRMILMMNSLHTVRTLSDQTGLKQLLIAHFMQQFCNTAFRMNPTILLLCLFTKKPNNGDVMLHRRVWIARWPSAVRGVTCNIKECTVICSNVPALPLTH